MYVFLSYLHSSFSAYFLFSLFSLPIPPFFSFSVVRVFIWNIFTFFRFSLLLVWGFFFFYPLSSILLISDLFRHTIDMLLKVKAVVKGIRWEISDHLFLCPFATQLSHSFMYKLHGFMTCPSNVSSYKDNQINQIYVLFLCSLFLTENIQYVVFPTLGFFVFCFFPH